MRELISLLFWVLLAAVAFGQGFNPYTPQSDPRAMRARREQAVTHVGSDQIARKIVEEFGEDAVAALLACSPETAKRLAQWHNNGDLNRQVVKPRDLLRVIGQPGAADEVAVFAMQNADKFGDVDVLDAYTSAPLFYTCGIKKLSDGASEMRARRVQVDAPRGMPTSMDVQTQLVVIGMGLVILVVIYRWWKSRQAECAAA